MNNVPTAEPDTKPEPRTGAGDLIAKEYDELRGLAARRMRDERECHTLTGTALVNEVAAKMLCNSQIPKGNRGQFLAFANKMMRNYLIDYARTRSRDKRGGNRKKQEFHEDNVEVCSVDDETSALNEVLQRLGEQDSRRAEVVRMRYLEEMSNEEIATALGVSLATVKRDWHVAKAWLANELRTCDHAS